LPDSKSGLSSSEQTHTGIDPRVARRRAVDHLAALQHPNGCWEGEMVWNTMILAQYIIVTHIVGRAGFECPPDPPTRAAMIRYFQQTRTPEGGWGLHPESGPYVYFTALAYVALRLLGVDPEDSLTAPARRWLRAQPEGVLGIPSWGKFWLTMIGLYDYTGVNPFPPEVFLLPRWLPVRLDNLYCHTRNIYQAIAYLYGHRFRADLGPLGDELREELYGGPVEPAVFAAHREVLAGTDVYVYPSPVLRRAYRAMVGFERIHPRRLRQRALEHCLNRIRDEQRVTNHQGLSPVNALLNCLALFAHDPNDPELAAGLAGVEYWRWSDAEYGIRYAGARSHSWDTAFALEALLGGIGAEDIGVEGVGALRRGYAYLRDAQMIDELPVPVPAGRAAIRGGWCFSDGGHRWPVSDCAAEAVGALLRAEPLVPVEGRITADRLAAAAEFILNRQNIDGSFGTYERRRAPRWLEALNPSEMFANCMVEGSYSECTGSALAALARLRTHCDPMLVRRIGWAIDRAVSFLRKSQRPDGSFAGCWGINFTYATFLAVRGLRAVGVPKRDPLCVRAATWLVNAQRPDGGWGEHYSGCLRGEYVEHPESQAVMTAWALLALLETGAQFDDVTVVRGIQWLCGAQRTDGSWPPGAVNGVFFGTAMLDYRLYPAYFPTWALGRYMQLAGSK
jgi:squalene/oxidosqualene cyclase-like protein